ncbi:MAG: SGNH/GDSL hydrolase family protein [Moorea sp. SIO3G5]|nr:SGNH/GDSL hydrolase family protein [Moorena sp. SIO3G5]
MKVLLLTLAVLVSSLVALEVGLRWLLGFGNPLIYVADEEIGYLLAPNQSTRRFGNRIVINEYSMRSPTTTPSPPRSMLRVFLLGDSVANGAWWTDQDQTISALLQSQLELWLTKEVLPRLTKEKPFETVEVLNASANSWGPRNELAYLRRFGTFNAHVVVLLINTDDLFATAPTSVQVGRDRNYPSQKPLLAIAEIWSRYLLRAPAIPEMEAVRAEPGDRVGFNLKAIGEIKTLTDAAGAKLVLGMTPLLREIGTKGPRDYELKARKRLSDFTQEHNITYLDFLPVFNKTEKPEILYRDHIHLSPQGNQKVSEVMSTQVASSVITLFK